MSLFKENCPFERSFKQAQIYLLHFTRLWIMERMMQ